MELATRPEDRNANGYTTILALFGKVGGRRTRCSMFVLGSVFHLAGVLVLLLCHQTVLEDRAGGRICVWIRFAVAPGKMQPKLLARHTLRLHVEGAMGADMCPMHMETASVRRKHRQVLFRKCLSDGGCNYWPCGLSAWLLTVQAEAFGLGLFVAKPAAVGRRSVRDHLRNCVAGEGVARRPTSGINKRRATEPSCHEKHYKTYTNYTNRYKHLYKHLEKHIQTIQTQHL